MQFEHQEFFVYMCTFELSKDIYALMKRAKRKKENKGGKKKTNIEPASLPQGTSADQ